MQRKSDKSPPSLPTSPIRSDDSDLLDAIVENIPNMIFVKDAEKLAFVLFNRAGEELLGTSRRDLLGKNDFDFFPQKEAEFFQAKDRETLENKVLVDIPEEPLQTKNGLRWLHTRKVPIVDSNGTPRYLLGISEDITEWKAADEQLRTAKVKAEAAISDLEAFSYSVAHDLRSPLRGIDGFSQALLEDYSDKIDETGQKYLRNVRQAAQRMARLIDDLLTLSKVSRADMAKERVDVSALSRKIVQQLREADPNRQVDVVIADGLVAQGDAPLLEVTLTHLIENAWKFTQKKEDARIEVGADKSSGGFFVKDNGAGFDMTYYEKLFGAFQRLHGIQEFEGTGIGLATVHRIVRRHGGRVWAEGKVGEGATFFFALDSSE